MATRLANMPSVSRPERGGYDVDINHQNGTIYSTIFSNKLIDLAISADEETFNGTSSEGHIAEGAADSTTTMGLPPCSDADKVLTPNWPNSITDTTSLTPDYILSSINKTSNYLENETESEGRHYLDNGVTNLQQRDIPSFNPRQKKRKKVGKPSVQNLLTVYSTPCSEYFPGFKQSKYLESEGELPQYVRKMMEKDNALKRLVKTGSVTISEVKNGIDCASDSGENSRDERFHPDDYSEQANGLDNSHSRPFAPLANVEDWETFPFARRLLELAKLSLTLPLSLSTTKPSASCDSLTGKSLVLNKVRKKPSKTSLLRPAVQMTQDTLVLKSTGKSAQKKQKLHSDTLSASTAPSIIAAPNVDISIEPLAPNIKTKRPSKRTNTGKRKPVQVEPPPLPLQPEVADAGNEEHEHTDNFHFDPIKFLEVSLQEDKAPQLDDSHRRKYKCNFCDKKFCWSTDLKRHTLIHTGERPFKCTECPANFTRKFLMQKHVKKVHPFSQEVSTDILQALPDSSSLNDLGANDDEETGGEWRGETYGSSEEFQQMEQKHDTIMDGDENDDEDRFDDLADNGTRTPSDEDDGLDIELARFDD